MNQSQTYICPLPPEPAPHSPPYPIPPCCLRAPALGSLHHTSNSHWLSLLHMVTYIFQCHSLKSSHPFLLLLCPKVCSLPWCFLCFPAHKIIGTIFLDSVFQCCSLKSSHPFLLPLCPKVCSLHLCFLCCPAHKIVGTIFLDSIYSESERGSEVAQLCPTLCNPMDCSLSGFSVHGILQARILEWAAISFSRRSS